MADNNSIITGDVDGDVTEAGGTNNGTAGSQTDTGDLNADDPDGDDDSWTVVAAGGSTDFGYGTYELSAAGVWVYTLNDNNAAVQALNDGETLTDTFTAMTTDSTPKVVTVTIHGQNDAATISGDATGSVTEAGSGTGTHTDTGDLDDTDVDNAQDAWQAVSAGGTTTNGYGTYALGADGIWVYTLDEYNAAVQALNAGGTLTDTFTALTADGTAQLVTVTINGANDFPVANPDVNGADLVTESGVNPGDSSAIGNVLTNDTDVDTGDTKTVLSVNGLAGNVGASVTGTYGSVTINADGSYTYTLDNSDTDTNALAQGASVTDQFTYTMTDSNGATSTSTLTITITGENDQPVAVADVNGADLVTESGVNPGDSSASGNVLTNDEDVDTGDTKTVLWVDGLAGNVGASVTGTYGSVTINSDGSYTYTLNNSDPDTQALAQGASVTDQFFYAITDANGATSSTTLTITINGTNDAAVIGGATTGSVTEDDATPNLTTAGMLTISDADAGESSFVAQGGTAGSNGYGTFTLAADGSWTYTAADNQAAIQQLGAGQSLTDSFTATSSDGSASQLVTVTINGLNDAAVITGTDTGSVTEDGTLTATGTVTATDPDAGQSSFQAQTGLTGTYGSLDIDAAGNWTYTLNNAAANVQALPAGATPTDTIQVLSFDGTTHNIVITVNGANDAPVANPDVNGADVVTETGVSPGNTPFAGDDTATGNVLDNDTDVDTGDTRTVTAVAGGSVGSPLEGTYGSVTIASDGSYTYTLNNNDTDTNGLPQGASATDQFTYTITDANGATSHLTLLITSTGTNDAPVANADSDTAVESGVGPGNTAFPGDDTATGNVLTNDTDVDSGDTKTVAAVGGSDLNVGSAVTGTYGSVTINADGSYTYTLDNSDTDTNALAQGATVTDQFTYTITDANGATSSSTLTISITGTNDAPVANPDVNGADVVTEAGVSPGNTPFAGDDTATGNVLSNDTDVDTGDTRTVTAVAGGSVGSPLEGTYGSVTINSDGSYTYTLNNGDTDTNGLPQGASATDQFTYTITDANGATSTSTLLITSTGTNDAPVANADSDTAVESGVGPGNTAFPGDDTATGNVLSNDTDVDSGDTKTVTAVTGGSVGTPLAGTYGSVTINANGSYTYTLDNNDTDTNALAQGAAVSEVFNYTMTDANGATSSSTLTISITGTNDAPVANPDVNGADVVTEAGVSPGNTPFAGDDTATGNVLSNDTDVDTGDTRTVTAVAGGSVGSPLEGTYGSVTINSNGSYTYTLNNGDTDTNGLPQGASATDQFTYTITDANGATSSSTLLISITGTNDAPTAPASQSITIDEDNASGATAIGASDVDTTDTLTYSVNAGGQPTKGSVSFNQGAGTFTYTPALNQNGSDSFVIDIVDNHGAIVQQTVNVTINPVDDEPTVTATAANPIYLEDTAAVDLFSSVAVSTIETGQSINSMTLTVTNVTDGASEILGIDGSFVTLTNGASVITATNGLLVSVLVSGSTATVSFSGESLSEAQLATLVDGLSYRNASQNPTDADRVVTITQLVDSGSNSAPDDNVAAPNLSSTVNVEPVNDAPTSTLLANDTRTYFEGNAPLTLDVSGNGTISDVDSANFAGGSLSLTIASALAEDNLVIINNASVTTSGANLSVNGTMIGTFSGGSGGTALVISFNSNATPAAVQLLVRTLGYSNGGGDTPVGGLRTVNWSLNDGDGNANGGNPTLAFTTKVNVVAVDDGPNGSDVTTAINEDQTYHLQTSSFTFTDPEGDAAGSLRFDSLPTHGTLYYDPDGAGPNAPFEVSPGLSVSWSTVSDVSYVPNPDYNGSDSFTFAIVDTGGAADPTPNTYTFNLAPINDSPVVPNSPTITVTEQTPAFVNPALAVSDVDLDALNGGAGDYGGATFLMNRSTGNDAQDEFIIAAGAGFTVTGGGDLQAGGLTFGHWVSNSGILEIDFNSAQTPATTALVNAVLQAIQYNNNSDTPPASIDLIYVLDDGAPDAVQGPLGAPFNNIDGGQVTVNITAIDDTPSIDLNGAAPGTGTSINYTENDPPTALVATASIVDPDSPDFDTGTLTVQFGGGTGTASDRLTIINQGTGAGQIGVSGANVTYGGVTIGSFTGGTSGSTPLVITFNANASQAAVTALMQEIAFSNVSDNPATADRQVTFDLTDGDGGQSNQASSVVHLTAVDDPTVANDDPGNATPENATVTIAVLANDSDPDGPPPAVAMVNGQAISVGSPVTLPSGAIVSLNANGTLTYDPNGQFNTLTSTSSGETGAVNTSAPDSFTYTLSAGPSATVSVTVNGVVSAQDRLEGDSGNNIITGTPNGDFFDLSQGGNDTASGLGANDGFFFGATFNALDHVDGGAGNNDQIGLLGDYTGPNALVMGPTTIANVEAIVVLPGYSYDITTVDGNVAAGGLLKVQATSLGAGESLTFDGSAETNGSFIVYGGQGDDNMTGGSGNDGFYFGPGGFNSSDTIDGGPGGNDQLALDGNYGGFGPAFVLGGNVTNVEVVVLLPGPSGSPNTFNLTTSDVLVPSGQTMTIFGIQVATNIIFDGSHEHDGAFRIYGGAGNDSFTGSDGNDWIFGGYGGDLMAGGAGGDTFYYDDAAQSTSLGFDTIFGFDDAADTIDVPFAVTGLAAPASGNLSNATFDADLGAAFAGLTSHQAGMFTATGGDMAGRTFLVIDADGNAGYQAGSDYVIEIVSPVTPIDNPAVFV